MSAALSGSCPVLSAGVRPNISPAFATYITLKNGLKIHIAPSRPARVTWATRPKRIEDLRDRAADPHIIEDVGIESELEAEIDDCLAGGDPPAGVIGLIQLATGGIKVIPVKGKAYVVKDSRTLARLLDRGLNDIDILAVLGRAQAKAKPPKWVRVSLSELRA
jgi:hypothetical protein